MGIFLNWKCFPPQAIPLLPLFHEITFSCVSCIFILLPTSQSSCSESSAFFSECFTDLHSMKIKHFNVTYLYFFCPYPIKCPQSLIAIICWADYLVYSFLQWWSLSPPSPSPRRRTLLMCSTNTFSLPPLHYPRELIQDACKTPANSGSSVSLSCIDFLWQDQDSSFHRHEDEDEIETFGDIEGIDIWNSIALKGEVVTTVAKLSGLQAVSVHWSCFRKAEVYGARQHCHHGLSSFIKRMGQGWGVRRKFCAQNNFILLLYFLLHLQSREDRWVFHRSKQPNFQRAARHCSLTHSSCLS